MAHQSKKTSPPLLPSTVVRREALLRTLEEALVLPLQNHSAVCKLVVLRAAAGYGKTTLLADFAKRNQIRIGWYFLESTDTNLPVFLETLTDIFCQAFSGIEQALHATYLQELMTALQSGNHQECEQALTLYTTILEQHMSHHFFLCLCNYQEVNQDRSIQTIMNHLLKNMPSRLSVLIESRAVPQLDFAPLLARRQFLGIGGNSLNFSPQEVREFSRLQQGFPIVEQEAERITDTFNGWITGILLSNSIENAHTSLHLFDEQKVLFLYIKNELFKTEKDAFIFLQETSLLSQLRVLHCNYLLQIERAEVMLLHIERQGLFVSRVENPEGILTYALLPVVRRLLYEDLQRRNPELVLFLHRRAAELFHASGEYEQAITHAGIAHEYRLVVNSIVNEAFTGQVQPSKNAIITHWMEVLPPSIYEENPYLLLIRAVMYLDQYNYLQAAHLLEKAHQLVLQGTSTINRDMLPRLQAEIILARSAILFQEGKYAETQQLCDEVLHSLSTDETEVRVPTLIRLGICKTLLGDYREGLTYLHQALQFSGHGSITKQTAYIHSCLANSYSLICNYALAEHHRERAITLYEHLNDREGKINNLIWMAILKRNKGVFQEAESMLQDILTLARQEGFQGGEAYTLFNLGANAIDTSTLPQALMALEESLKIARQIGDNRLKDQCLCELAMAYLLLEDSYTAQFLLTQTTIATEQQTGYERLEYELVRGTILLYQEDLPQAYACFQTLVSRAQSTQLKRIHIECLMRLAVCQYRLNQLDEMEATLEHVVHLVTQGFFEHVPLIELRRFPDVWQAVQKLPNKACVTNWRDPSLVQEEDEPQEPKRPALALTSSSEPDVRLRIQAFGEPLVMIDGVPITRWYMARSMEMCFFFLEQKGPIRKEQLVEALWPKEAEYVDQTIRSALHYLRKVIGLPCIVSRAGTYTLDLSTYYGENIWYDVTLFRSHAMQAKEAQQQEFSEKAEEHLQALVGLYRGDYVQSFYSNWCIPIRDELRKLYMDARQDLARLDWNAGRFEESLAHWQYMLAIDVCSEEAHYGLMRCYARLGKRTLAIRQYQRCAEIMQRELAISPGPALQKLYERLKNINL